MKINLAVKTEEWEEKKRLDIDFCKGRNGYEKNSLA
jgi:hypothetical protein